MPFAFLASHVFRLKNIRVFYFDLVDFISKYELVSTA